MCPAQTRLILLIAFAPSLTSAQLAPGPPFSLPRPEAIHCSRLLHVVPGHSYAGSGSQVEVEIGQATDPVDRLIKVAYDSGGEPIQVVDIVTVLLRDSSATITSAGALFTSKDSARGFVAVSRRMWRTPEERLAPFDSSSIKTVFQPLARTDAARARTLAAWARRQQCGSPPRGT